MKKRYLIAEVKFKTGKHSNYQRGIGIFHLKPGETIDYTNCVVTVIPFSSLATTTEPTTIGSFRLYNVIMDDERHGLKTEFLDDIQLKETMQITDIERMEAE